MSLKKNTFLYFNFLSIKKCSPCWVSEGKRKRYTLCVPTVPVAMSTQSSLLFNLSDCLSLSPSLFLHWLYCSALMCSPSRKHDKLSTWGGTTGGKVKERETDTGDGAGKMRWHRLRRGTETRIQKHTGWKNGESGKKDGGVRNREWRRKTLDRVWIRGQCGTTLKGVQDARQ